MIFTFPTYPDAIVVRSLELQDTLGKNYRVVQWHGQTSPNPDDWNTEKDGMPNACELALISSQ